MSLVLLLAVRPSSTDPTMTALEPLAYGTSNVSSVATSPMPSTTPAVAPLAMCGNPLGPTYLSQAMIIPNERTRLEVCPLYNTH